MIVDDFVFIEYCCKFNKGMQEIMMGEFKILSKYLSGVECSDSYLKEIFEAKFGKQKLNFINRMWIVIYWQPWPGALILFWFIS